MIEFAEKERPPILPDQHPASIFIRSLSVYIFSLINCVDDKEALKAKDYRAEINHPAAILKV